MDYQFGVDYYPEHWPRERLETDVKLMQEMGIDVVRMAEFSWSKLEPAEGEFCFDWLDEAISLLAAHGIKTILGTPSAAPPAWIIEKNPEIQPIDKEGRLRHFGGRHHDCQSSEVYRRHIRRYVTAFAQHFGGNPNVIGWQVDNELGNSHQDLCMCSSCEKAFQHWLEKKYADIETLNVKWGTTFWSQGYNSFSQIQAPLITVTGHNPSEILDWRRFCSDLIVDFHKLQADILRAAAPEKFITHNMMGFADKVNYYDLGNDLDFASHDQYPTGHFRPVHNILLADRLAAELDFIRSVKHRSFWIMEQQAGMTGWEILGRAPQPGQLGMWAMQSVAHGADTIVFFRWRSCAIGTEQYWHGILPHSGIPGRYYRELKEFMQKNRSLLKEIQGSVPETKVGILRSYDQEYAIKEQPHHPDMSYIDHMMKYYTALFNKNIPVDFLSDEDDFENYSLIIAPLQYLMTSALADKYKAFVKDGGHLLLTMRAGVKDDTNICMTSGPLPGELRELVGLEIPEYDCLRDTEAYVTWDGARCKCEKWCDIINTDGAETLACYDSEFYKGTAAITVNSYGEGKAYYVGTEPGPELADKIVCQLLGEQDLNMLADSPEGVEIVHRRMEDKRYIFVINHTSQKQTIKIPQNWQPYFEGQSECLEGFAVQVYTD